MQIIGGPYLVAPSPTGVTLVWLTNNKAVSKVEFGTRADQPPKAAVSAHHGLIDANTTLHRITLSGLRPGTTYQYRAVSTEIVEFQPYRVKYGATVSKEGSFTILDPAKEKFSLCVFNDCHDHVPELRKALGSIKWEGVDLVVALGDMMSHPESEEQLFRNFINPCTEFFARHIPLIFVRGNHETRGALARNLLEYFPSQTGRYYYSFDHGGVHFVVLDGGEDKADSNPEYSGLAAFDDYLKQETEWLESELMSPAFAAARFRVCLLHMPPAAGKADGPEFIRRPWIRDHWTSILGQAGLDLMICGHTHRYAELPANGKRSYPIVIGGTETVIRVDVSPERLEITAFNDDGTVLARPAEVRRRQ